MSQIYAYLDWNVIDWLQKIQQLKDPDREAFELIASLVENDVMQVPYSNAHISDLVRGYKKNPDYTEGDLKFISQVTNNLCIVQYWGEKETVWHYRDVFEFFNASLEESELKFDSFSDLFDDDYLGVMKPMVSIMNTLPLPGDVSKAFGLDPIFDKVFAKTKAKPTMGSLLDDILILSNLVKTDYSIYKALRGFREKMIKKYKNDPVLRQQLEAVGNTEGPNFLKMSSDETYEWARSQTAPKPSSNADYDLLINTYLKIDWRGFKSDERFDNMIDDALHTFYAGHCQIFITKDDKCHYKATKTFEELRIETKVFKPTEFLTFFREGLNHSNSEM